MFKLPFVMDLDAESDPDFVPHPLLPDTVRPTRRPVHPSGSTVVGVLDEETYELTVLATGHRHLHVGSSRPLPQGRILRLFGGRPDRFRGFDHSCSVILSVPGRRANQWWAVLRPAAQAFPA